MLMGASLPIALLASTMFSFGLITMTEGDMAAAPAAIAAPLPSWPDLTEAVGARLKAIMPARAARAAAPAPKPAAKLAAEPATAPDADRPHPAAPLATAPPTPTAAAAAPPMASSAPAHAAVPSPAPTEVWRVATPASLAPAADPHRPERLARQAGRRLGIVLDPAGARAFRWHAPDGLAHVALEVLPDGGCQLQLVTDLTFLQEDAEVRAHLAGGAREGGSVGAFLDRFPGRVDWWLRERPSFALVDAYVARYMPAAAGASRQARLGWWSGALKERLGDALRAAQEEAPRPWNPTFNVGSRLGQAVLDDMAFSLVLYVPPEDPGL